MKIFKILNEIDSDFWAIYECEYCGHKTEREIGYHDNYFHTKVIPGKFCKKCGKNRAGEQKPNEQNY